MQQESMPLETLAIINPCSGSGATGRRVTEIERKLEQSLGPVDVRLTSARRDAEEIARKAAEIGVRRIVVVGGDGTASEVASGLLASGRASHVALGLLPMGTGGDLARSLGLPRDLDTAIQGLTRTTTRRIDAGCVHYQDLAGKPTVAHFLNVGSFGLSGLTDLYVERSPRMFGGTVAFAIAAIRSIIAYRRHSAVIRVDGHVVHRGPINLAAVANGRYFGGGMRIAPSADLESGIFDVVIVGDLSKFALLRKFPKLFTGSHIHDSAVTCHRGTSIEVAAPPGTILLDIDGEALGTVPAMFEILPRAITLFGVPEALESGSEPES
jgi:diacylglycerol kinase (ATP)